MNQIMSENNRGLKEWAVSCDALRDGRQTLLIRKGGIREKEGVFTVVDEEFFLIPTYDHQNAAQLQPEFVDGLHRTLSNTPQSGTLQIDTYARIVKIVTASDEQQLLAASEEHIWNRGYIKQRFNFNPYDPLQLLILRTYRLPHPVEIPLKPEYGGCTSWITLDASLSTKGAEPSLSETEFSSRFENLCTKLQDKQRP